MNLRHRVALVGILLGILTTVEMFGATLNRETDRQFDVTSQTHGEFSIGTAVNYSLDSVQATLLAIFLLGAVVLYGRAGWLTDGLKIGIGAAFLLRLGAALWGNYTALYPLNSPPEQLVNLQEIILYQQWYWVMGLVLFGLASQMWIEKPLMGITLLFGIMMLAGGVTLAATGEWMGWVDLARYIAMPIWATICAAYLLIYPTLQNPT